MEIYEVLIELLHNKKWKELKEILDEMNEQDIAELFMELEERDLKDNTVVLLFGDHNTYYQGLSNYVKNIYNTESDNYTNLYRVPCMIYHPDKDVIINQVETNNADKMSSRYVVNTYANSNV